MPKLCASDSDGVADVHAACAAIDGFTLNADRHLEYVMSALSVVSNRVSTFISIKLSQKQPAISNVGFIQEVRSLSLAN